MKSRIQSLLRRLILWATASAIKGMVDKRVSFAHQDLHGQMRLKLSQIRAELASLQALDVDFEDTGKLVLVARVGGRDIVKIINAPKEWTMRDYKQTIEELEQRFGARPRYFDGAPVSMDYLRRDFERGQR